MTSDDQDVPEVGGDEAVVHALLAERLGDEAMPDVTAAVLARAAARRTAAARVAAASTAMSPARSRWAAAAAILLGCAVVAGVMWSRRAPPAPAPVQDPAPRQDPEVIDVDSVARLRELLPQVVGMRVEAWFLLRNGDLDLRSAPPWEADPATVRAVVQALAEDPALSVTPPAGWKWQNRLLLMCRDGRAIVLALNRYTRGTVGTHGLQGDFFVAQTAPLVEALANAEQSACEHLGVVRRRQDLAEGSPFRAKEALTLAENPIPEEALSTKDMEQLATFPRLRRLDVGTMAAHVDGELLARLATSPSIEELVLDGAPIEERDLLPLAKTRLRRLSLQRCKAIRAGTAFISFADDAVFAGLAALDLSFCELFPVALAALELPALRELRLRGTRLPGNEAIWQLLARHARLSVLDLGEHDLSQHVIGQVVGIPTLAELHLPMCEIDDDDLAVVATAKGPLAVLGLQGNPGITIRGLRRIADLPTLQEVRLSASAGVTDQELVELRATRPRLKFMRL